MLSHSTISDSEELSKEELSEEDFSEEEEGFFGGLEVPAEVPVLEELPAEELRASLEASLFEAGGEAGVI